MEFEHCVECYCELRSGRKYFELGAIMPDRKIDDKGPYCHVCMTTRSTQLRTSIKPPEWRVVGIANDVTRFYMAMIEVAKESPTGVTTHWTTPTVSGNGAFDMSFLKKATWRSGSETIKVSIDVKDTSVVCSTLNGGKDRRVIFRTPLGGDCVQTARTVYAFVSGYLAGRQ